MISYPAPLLVQGSDQDALLTLGEIISPGFLKRAQDADGLRLWVDGQPNDEASRREATRKFQTLLGVLRSWRPNAGELREEQRGGLGSGSVRDRHGNQWLQLSTVIDYSRVGDEIPTFGDQAKRALDSSTRLRKALQIYGQSSRTADEYYLIFELAEHEFGDKPDIAKALGVSRNDLTRLTRSANVLSELEGGRHAEGSGRAPWDLEQQAEFVAEMLRAWIGHAAAADQ